MPPPVNVGDFFSSQLMIEETFSVHKQLSPSLSSDDYLNAPSLPLDLVEEEILCRLPVKVLLQIRCVCKSWNSLISDPRFAKKHLSMSTTRRLHILRYSDCRYIIDSFPLHCIFTTVSTNVVTQIEYPSKNRGNTRHEIIGSCNGILCLSIEYSKVSYILLWNPSIRKVKELPRLELPCYANINHTASGFGYDFVTENYKVVVVFKYREPDSNGGWIEKTIVKVNTLGTNFWKNIQEFPFDSTPDVDPGKFVSGTINWLASKRWRESPCFIVSLDLGNESYQTILLPDHGEEDVGILYLSVLSDCLCMIYGHDVWIMKEYGNKKSWTKLFSVPYMQDPSKSYHHLTRAIYMFDDDHVLLKSWGGRKPNLILYDPKIDTFNFIKFQNKSIYDKILYHYIEVCIESLISPCT